MCAFISIHAIVIEMITQLIELPLGSAKSVCVLCGRVCVLMFGWVSFCLLLSRNKLLHLPAQRLTLFLLFDFVETFFIMYNIVSLHAYFNYARRKEKSFNHHSFYRLLCNWLQTEASRFAHSLISSVFTFIINDFKWLLFYICSKVTNHR